jgi:hypothetical protein
MLKTLLQLVRYLNTSASPPSLSPSLLAAQTPLADFRALQAPIEAQRAAPAPAWQALPGLVLGLGSTGFEIHMNLGHATPRLPSRYTLINPEGLIECWGVDLAGIKQHAERLVRDRAEFVCAPTGWLP